jgi:hypothetical protein
VEPGETLGVVVGVVSTVATVVPVDSVVVVSVAVDSVTVDSVDAVLSGSRTSAGAHEPRFAVTSHSPDWASQVRPELG